MGRRRWLAEGEGNGVMVWEGGGEKRGRAEL